MGAVRFMDLHKPAWITLKTIMDHSTYENDMNFKRIGGILRLSLWRDPSMAKIL